MDNSDESILNNHHIDPTLELIDIEGVSPNTLDYYSKSNTRKEVSEI
jgi:hypothetical protein